MPASKQKHSLTEQLKGFPTAQILLVGLARIADPITFTAVFPYIYFMVKDFHIASSEGDVSKYVGYLSSTIAVCEFVSTLPFSVLLERYGRKFSLVFGLSFMAICSVGFGFSGSYWQAMFWRSMIGLTNGFCLVVRTVVGEIAQQRRHQPLLFASLPLGWSVGAVIGPLIPAIFLIRTDTGIFSQYPYAMPNIVIAVILLVSTVLITLFLKETHPKLKFQRDRGRELGLFLFGSKVNYDPLQDEETPLLEEEVIEEVDSDSIKSNSIITRRESEALISIYEDRKSSATSIKTLLLPQVFLTLTSSFIMSSHCLIFDEFLPVFLSLDVLRLDPTDPASPLLSQFPFKIIGGLGLTSTEIGNVLAFTGTVGIFVGLFAFPYLDGRFNSLSLFRVVLFVFPLAYFFLPYLLFSIEGPKWLTTVSVYTFFLIKAFGQSMAFPEIMIFVHRCSPPEQRALVNGVLMSSTLLSRFVGPFLFGWLMSWSSAHELGWLPWFTLAGISFVGWIQTFFITEEDQDEDE